MSILACILVVLVAIVATIFATYYFLEVYGRGKCVFDGQSYAFIKPPRDKEDARRAIKIARERFINKKIREIPSSCSDLAYHTLCKYDPEFKDAMDRIIANASGEYRKSKVK